MTVSDILKHIHSVFFLCKHNAKLTFIKIFPVGPLTRLSTDKTGDELRFSAAARGFSLLHSINTKPGEFPAFCPLGIWE